MATPEEIADRINEITFNAALVGEMRAITFVQRLIDEGRIAPAMDIPSLTRAFTVICDAEQVKKRTATAMPLSKIIGEIGAIAARRYCDGAVRLV